MTTSTTAMLLKVASVLWIVWGLVHAFAGILTITQSAPNSIAGIADAVDPSLLVGIYHPAVDAVINQHGFNLLWIGIFTIVGGIFIWRQNVTWLFFTAVVGWFTDIGYFVFMDLGGFVNFAPGTIMTIISTAAVALSLVAWQFDMRRRA